MSRDAWRLAVGTLTTWPVTPPSRVDPAVAGLAMLLAPVVVLPLAGACAVLAVGVRASGGPPLLAATLVVGLAALSTRGLHLDGLADTADGLCSGHDRERALAVMKRGDTGPGGVASLVLVLLVQVAALAAILAASHGIVFATIALLTSRLALTWCCRRGIPPAGPSGLGHAVSGTVSTPAALGSTLLLSAVAAGASFVLGSPLTGPLSVLGGLAAGAVLLARCRARLGGVTGDVLGAVVEVSLAGALTIAALLG